MRKFFFLAGLLIIGGCISVPKAPDLKYKLHETIKQNPQVMQDETGKQYKVFNSTEHTIDMNYERADKPLSLWQKFCNWLSGLSILAILGLGVGFFMAPGATGVWLFRRYLGIKKALTQTVDAIEKAKAVDANPDLKVALSSAQDADTKRLVDDLKRA